MGCHLSGWGTERMSSVRLRIAGLGQRGSHLSGWGTARMPSVRLRTTRLGDRWAVTCYAGGQLECNQFGWGTDGHWVVTS
jgi:hypothetical protein